MCIQYRRSSGVASNMYISNVCVCVCVCVDKYIYAYYICIYCTDTIYRTNDLLQHHVQLATEERRLLEETVAAKRLSRAASAQQNAIPWFSLSHGIKFAV
jgi:hypothetical protein